MKKIYTLIFGLLFALSFSQIVNIPDAIFKAKLLEASPSNQIAKDLSGNYFKIDANGDGKIQVSEAEQVSYLNVETPYPYNYPQSQKIHSLEGILSFSNLQILKCDYNKLTSLNVQGLSNLQSLSCLENAFTSLINLEGCNLTNLNLSYDQYMSDGIFHFDVPSTSYQNVKSIRIKCIPNLIRIESENHSGYSRTYNAMDSLVIDGVVNLESINLNSHIPKVVIIQNCPKLKSIIINKIKTNGERLLTSITIKNCPNLEELICPNNGLTSLPIENCPNLKVISCPGNQFASLNLSEFTKLEYLNIANYYQAPVYRDIIDYPKNTISTINLKGLTHLKELECTKGVLTELLNISDAVNLRQLKCSDNLLTSLTLQGFQLLEDVWLNKNKLTTLTIEGCVFRRTVSLDGTIPGLNCADNQLNSIFMKGTTINEFNYSGRNFYRMTISNNPLKNICCDESQMAQIKNLLNNSDITGCEVNSYCTFDPPLFNTISGNIKLDNDNNGCDAYDLGYPYVKVKITDGTNTLYTFTDSSGKYLYNINSTNFTVTPQVETRRYYQTETTPPNSNIIFLDSNHNSKIQDFCVMTTPGVHNDLYITIIPIRPARPGFDATYKILYENKGTTTLSGDVAFRYDEDKLDFVSATVSPATQASGRLTWSYTDLKPFERREVNVTMNVNSPMETPPVNIGDKLDYFAQINPITEDEIPNDNAFELKQTIVGAYDPNDKTCLEGSTVTPNMVGNYVNYLIRFENTGNYPAEKIVVIDYLDAAKFDVSTFEVVSSSHPKYQIRIDKNNKLEVYYDQINLPGTPSPDRHGYFAFKIKTKPSLAIGTELKNKAEIYFDYNFPVITNEAITTVKPDPTVPPGIPVITQPANNATNLSLSGNKLIWTASTDVYGYKIKVGTTSGGSQTINTQVSGSVLEHTLPTLAYATTYYAIVTAINQAGETISDEVKFTTQSRPVTPPTTIVPVIISPVNNATDIDVKSIVVQWTGVPTATKYYVKVGSTSGQSDVFAGETTSTYYQLPKLEKNRKYYLTVIAVTPDGVKTSTEVSFFGVDNLNSTIYPNPVGDVLHINSDDKVIKAEIYDLDGRLRLTTTNITNNTLNLSSLPTGSYIIKFITDTNHWTEKMYKR